MPSTNIESFMSACAQLTRDKEELEQENEKLREYARLEAANATRLYLELRDAQEQVKTLRNALVAFSVMADGLSLQAIREMARATLDEAAINLRCLGGDIGVILRAQRYARFLAQLAPKDGEET